MRDQETRGRLGSAWLGGLGPTRQARHGKDGPNWSRQRKAGEAGPGETRRNTARRDQAGNAR